MRTPMTILLTIAAVYALICLAAYLLQSQMIFFPDRKLVATPADVGLEYREVFLDAEDGIRIHGWFVPAEGATRALLYLHGNAGNISHRVHSIRALHSLGLAVLIIDYRGYGRSGGRPSEHGAYQDARAAWRYLIEVEKFDPATIIYYGRSLGSAVAIELAAAEAPGAVIAHSAFTSLVDIGARVYPWLPVRLLARIRFDCAMRIGAVTCPKLFVHSREDEIIPYELGRRLYDLAPGPKQFLDIGGDHNQAFLGESPAHMEALSAFIGTLAPAR